MGFLDKLKEKGRGVITAAKPQEGVAAAGPDEVRSRLHAISGKGIEAGDDGEEVVVSWSAKVASAGVGGGEYEYRYRAIRVDLDPDSSTARGSASRPTPRPRSAPMLRCRPRRGGNADSTSARRRCT